MKGRYLVAVAVLLMSVFVLTLPAGSEDVTGADSNNYPQVYTELDEQTRVLIGSDYSAAMPFTEGGTDPDERVRVKSDATGNNYIGYFNGQLFLVLDAPQWVSGQESSLPRFTAEYGGSTYEFGTASLGDVDRVSVFQLTAGANLTMEPFLGGVYIENTGAPEIYKGYCYVDTSDWVIYDESQDAEDGHGEFVGSIIMKGHTLSVDDPTPLSMVNGVYDIASLKGQMTVSVVKDGVTYSMAMQPLAGDNPATNTSYTVAIVNKDDYPLQVNHSSTDGRYSLRVHYTDSAGEDFSFQYDSVRNYLQNMYFNVAVHDEVYIGNAATHNTALAFTNNEHAPTIVYGGYQGDPVYRYNAPDGYDSDVVVAVAPVDKTYSELCLIEGEIVLTSGNKMRVDETVIGAVSGTVTLAVPAEENMTVTVASGESFTLDGRIYTAVGNGDVLYTPYNYDESSEDLHGILLASNQSIGLGNSALAIYDANTNTSVITRAIRNENSTATAAKSLTVDNSTDPLSLSTSDTDLFIGTYVLTQGPTLTNRVLCSVTDAPPFRATVDPETGEVSVTSGSVGSVTILEAGEQLNLPGGTIYAAVSKSVFSGSESDLVMESGKVNISSNGTTSITIRRPDNSTFTATGISQVTLGGTCSFTATEGTVSFGNIASYEVVSESQFTLDSDSVLRLYYGRVIVSQGDSISFVQDSEIMELTAPADSAGEMAYTVNPSKVYVYSGVFTITYPTQAYSCDIGLMASGSGLTYEGTTVTYAGGETLVDLYGGSIRMRAGNQSVSFDGEILTYNRSFTSVGGPATIRTGDTATDVPTLISGTVNTAHDIFINDINFAPYPGAILASSGTATVQSTRSITVTATFNPPQGDPVERSLTYSNGSDTDDLVLSFALGDDLTATLVSGSVRFGSGTAITVADNQYTAVSSGTVITLDNGTPVVEQGIVETSSHVWNGVSIQAVNSTSFRINSSLNRIVFSSSAQLKFRGEDPVYTFNSENRFLVTSDGKVLLTDGTSLIMAEGGSIYLGTEANNYLVENIDDETVFVSSAYTVTGIGDGKSVRISSGTSAATVTRNGGFSDVSVSIYPSDGSLYLGGGSGIVMVANLVLNNMTFRNNGSLITGEGTLTVESRSEAVTATYVSGTFEVNGSMLFDTTAVSGEFSVSSGDTRPLVTVPASGSITVTPTDGDPVEYANASSTDPLVFAYVDGELQLSEGEYRTDNATIFDFEISLVSGTPSTFIVGSDAQGMYVTASSEQKLSFDAAGTENDYTYTAYEGHTAKFRFISGVNQAPSSVFLSEGAVVLASNGNSGSVTLGRDQRYSSGTGAVISVRMESSTPYGELLSGSADVPSDGTTLFVAGTEYLAAGNGATLSISGSTAVLESGTVQLDEGESILAGGVTVTNTGDSSDLTPTIDLYYDSDDGDRIATIETAGVTVTASHNIDTYTFTSTDACEISIADDGRFSAHDGSFTLADGQSIMFNGVTVTSSGTSTLSVDSEILTIVSGSVTLSSPISFYLNDVGILGATAATVSDDKNVFTVSIPAGGTSTFAPGEGNDYSYANASSTEPLGLIWNTKTSARFVPESGSYYMQSGDTVTINDVIVSFSGGGSITVDLDSDTVTADSGQTVTFSSDTSVSYTAVSDGTSFTVNSFGDIPLRSGSVSLEQSQGILIGGSEYTAVSSAVQISSVSDAAVLVSGSVTVPAGKNIRVGSYTFTAGDKAAIISVSDGAATLESETFTVPAGASILIGSVTVRNSGSVAFTLDRGGLAVLTQNASLRTTYSGTSREFTASSDTMVSVGPDGVITVIQTDGMILPKDESLILGDLTFTAVGDAAQISVNDGIVTLVSGTLSISSVSDDSPTRIVIGGTDIRRASEASVGTSAKYVVAPGGTTLSIGDDDYVNASASQGMRFTDSGSGFVLTEGAYTVTLSNDNYVTVGGYRVSSATGAGITFTIGPDTVSSSTTAAVRFSKDQTQLHYVTSGSALFTLGTNVVLTSGTVTVPQNGTVQIGDTVYTAGSGATVSAENGTATLEAGSVTVPAGKSITVQGVTCTAYGDDGAQLELSQVSGTYYITVSSGHVDFSSSSVISGLKVCMDNDDTEVRFGTYRYKGSGVTLDVDDGAVSFSTTDVWVTFTGSITVAGTVFSTDGWASLSTDLSHASLGTDSSVSFAGSTSNPVTLYISRYSITTEYSVTVGYSGTYELPVITLESGAFVADSQMPVTVGSDGFEVGQGVQVALDAEGVAFTIPGGKSVSYPDGTSQQGGETVNVTGILTNNGTDYVTFVCKTQGNRDKYLTLPANANVTFGADGSGSVTAGPEETNVMLGSPVTLSYGSLVLSSSESVMAADSRFTSAADSTVIGLATGNPVLTAGAATYSSASLYLGQIPVTHSGSGTLTLDCDSRTVTLSDTGCTVTTTSGNTFTSSSGAAVLSISENGALSVSSGTVSLAAGESATFALSGGRTMTVTAVTDAELTSSPAVSCPTLDSGSVTFSSSGTVIIAGITVSGMEAASVSDTEATVSVSSGGSVTVGSRTYIEASSDVPLVLSLDRTQTRPEFVPSSGSYKLFQGETASLCGVSISYTSQSTDDFVVVTAPDASHGDMGLVAAFQGQELTFGIPESGPRTYQVSSSQATFTVSGTSVVSLSSGNLTMTKGEYVVIAGNEYRAYGGSSEISRTSEGVTIVDGTFEMPAGASVAASLWTFQAVSSGTMLTVSGNQVILDSGSVSVFGTFQLTSGDVTVAVQGDDAITTVGVTDITTSLSVKSVNDCIVTTATSDASYSYHTSVASLSVTAVSDGTGTASSSQVPKVVLGSGFVTMSEGSVLYTEGLNMQYLRFDQVGDKTVTVGISDGRPLVEVATGSVNLTDAVDPTYENLGSNTLSFFADNSQNIELEDGTVNVPERSTVKIGERYVTNVSGTVYVSSEGVVTVMPGSEAVVSNENGDSYTITNDTSEPVERDVAQEDKEDGYAMFENHRTNRIYDIREMDANTQAVRALIEQTVQSLEAAVYDASKTADENLETLDRIYSDFIDRYESTYKPDPELFADYKSSAQTELEKLHIGETSITERIIIDNLLSELSDIEYSSNMSLDENKAQVDAVLSEANHQLSYYRIADSATFNVYKSVMLEYIDTQPESGLEEIGALKEAYRESLSKLKYLSSQDKDRNLQRIDELIDAFDGEVISTFISKFNAHKATVIGNILTLSATYSEPEVLEYIDNARVRLENYAYDQGVLYQDNLNRVDNLYTNLTSNIGAAVVGNINTFNDYCDKYRDKYTEVHARYLEVDPDTDGPKYHPELPFGDPIRVAILEAILEARDKVDRDVEGHITYDHKLSLADNVALIHKIASDLEDEIEYISSEDMRNELEKTYSAALEHFAKNDKPETPTKLREKINEYRDQVIAEFKSNHDVDVKGETINQLMVDYDTEMGVLIQRADFYFNIDRGCTFLQTKYETAQPVVITRMNECITELAAFEYRENLTLSQNLELVQQTVNNYSLELTNLKATTNEGDFENYRDYVAWRVGGFSTSGASAAVDTHVQKYVTKISALTYNGKSLYSNKVAVDNLYQEFYDGYEALLFDEHRGDLVTIIEDLATAQDAVRKVVADGVRELNGFRYRMGEYDGCIAEIDALCGLIELRVGYAKALADENAGYFDDRITAISGTAPVNVHVQTAKALAVSDILDAKSSALSFTQKVFRISAIDYGYQDLLRFDDAYVQALDDMAAAQSIDDSAKVRAITEKYGPLLEEVYDTAKDMDANIAAVKALVEEYRAAVTTQRYNENSTVTGGIRADGKAVDGTDAEYPEGTNEIWGSVGNLSGLEAGVSVTLSLTRAGDVYGGTAIPAEGNGFAILGNGDVLGAVDVTLYKDGEKITDFNGTYRVRILLPADMRGYETMQVAYVDEYGDVQVYNAKVVGNYVEFYTTHFSSFTLVGLRDIPTYYDIYVYIAVTIIVLALAFYFARVVRYDANGGSGRTPGQVFFFDGEGPLTENGFTREGYRFRGWSRTRDGVAEFTDCSDLSALGKIHLLRLYAVWEEVH